MREQPGRGFFVEGLHEYLVRSYEEAVALLNLGLENRALAPTMMNTTSSRSHTVLTLVIEQRGATGGGGATAAVGAGKGGFTRTVRGKLMFVDLAGSERVRRTTSKGTRLSEAKSINTSLSALGNVIAALADPSVTHVPFRDSKLTRLLQDSLGGTANTTLIATVGPASANLSETLSTLLFAARCMHVQSRPQINEEVDYREQNAQLQARIAGMERVYVERETAQQERYEEQLQRMQAQIVRCSTRRRFLRDEVFDDVLLY